MPSGPKTRVVEERSSLSPVTASTTKPSMSAPRSEYSKYWPGGAQSGVEITAARASSGVRAMRHRSRPAGRPERCASSMRMVTWSFAPPVNAGRY